MNVKPLCCKKAATGLEFGISVLLLVVQYALRVAIQHISFPAKYSNKHSAKTAACMCRIF